MQAAKLSARSSHGERLRSVFDYAAVHLDEPLRLTKAAEIAGLEHTYFSKLFRKVTGTTFVDWNRVRRVERAKTLLSESDLNVVSIGFAVGYSDVTTFCRAFRKATGVAPREYRATCQRRDQTPAPPGEHARTSSHATEPRHQETPRLETAGFLD